MNNQCIRLTDNDELMFLEDYYKANPRPVGLPLGGIHMAIDNLIAQVRGLLSLGEDGGFTLKHRDVMEIIRGVEGNLELIEYAIGSARDGENV